MKLIKRFFSNTTPKSIEEIKLELANNICMLMNKHQLPYVGIICDLPIIYLPDPVYKFNLTMSLLPANKYYIITSEKSILKSKEIINKLI